MSSTGSKIGGSSSVNMIPVKWQEFDSFVVSGFSHLYQKDDFTDVTLVCEGRSFKVHKVILSVWSSYFREILMSNPQQHPVIILRQTRSEDVELILRFIYQGQLSVSQEDADRFLKTAESFHIAGLSKMRILTVTTNNCEIPSCKPFVHPATAVAVTNTTASKLKTTFSTSTRTSSGLTDGDVPISNNNNVIRQTAKFQRLQQHQVSAQQNPQSQSSTLNRVQGTGVYQQHQQQVTISPIMQNQSLAPQNLQGVRDSTASSSNSNYMGPIIKDIQSKSTSEPVVVLENFIGPDDEVELTEVPNGDITVTTGSTNELYSTVYDPQPGGPTSQLVQIHNSTDETILGYTYIEGNAEVNTQSLQDSAAPITNSTPNDPEIIDLVSETGLPGQPIIMTPVGPSSNSNITTINSMKSQGVTSKPKRNAQSNNITSKKKVKPEIKSDADQEYNGSAKSLVPCPKCGKRVKQTSLRVHMKRSHLDEGVVLVCPVCGKQISSKGVYYKHMYIHRRKSEVPKSTSIANNDSIKSSPN